MTKFVSFFGAVATVSTLLGTPAWADTATSQPAMVMETGSFNIPSMELDPSVQRGIALRVAAREGRYKRVEELLNQGVSPDADGQFGETALMAAARFGQVRAVEVLLERGAEPNARDAQDQTPLLLAARDCSLQIVSLLLEKGANPGWVSHSGSTPLIEAAMGGCPKVVGLLLRTGKARVEHADNAGMTALDHASEGIPGVGGRYMETVEELRAALGLGAPAKRADSQQLPEAPRTLP